jgi:hypothetical protein
MHTIQVDVSTGDIVQIPYTTEQQAEYDIKQSAWDAGANDRKASEVRAERNIKLSETDWTQIADATADKAAWATYRQALRNISTQAEFPNNVTWPTQP